MGTAIGTDVTGTVAAAYTEQTQSAQKKNKVNGKTIGEPKLSDKGAKYYEQLKAKYGNYDFILVSRNEKENAEKNAAQYANQNKTVVLIDEDKIEQMATDSEYRKKYENILSGAQAQLKQMAEQFSSTPGVKGFGMKVGDNGAASFFAAVDKNAAANAKAQQKRQQKKAEEKKTEKKNAEKKAQKKADQKRLEKLREDRKTDKADQKSEEDDDLFEDEDIEIVTASSVEELMKKVQDVTYSAMSDRVRTQQELAVGGHIDFKG